LNSSPGPFPSKSYSSGSTKFHDGWEGSYIKRIAQEYESRLQDFIKQISEELVRPRIPRLELAVQKHSRFAAIAALTAWGII